MKFFNMNSSASSQTDFRTMVFTIF